MIVGSVLLVLAAGVLLGIGLVRSDDTILYWSIGVSALAAAALAMGVRRLLAVRAGRGEIVVRLGVGTRERGPITVEATVLSGGGTDGGGTGGEGTGGSAPGRATPR